MISSIVDRSNSERQRRFGKRLTDRQADICYCRVAFTIEKLFCWRQSIFNFKVEKRRFSSGRSSVKLKLRGASEMGHFTATFLEIWESHSQSKYPQSSSFGKWEVGGEWSYEASPRVDFWEQTGPGSKLDCISCTL